MDDNHSNEWLAGELMEKLIKTFIRDDSFDDPINQEVLEKLRAWLVAGLGHSRVIKDPAENRLFTLKAARRLDWRRKNRLCVNQNCQPWREYKRAIDAMIEPSQGCRRLVEPSPHAGGSGVPPVPPPPPPSPIRGPKKKFTPVQKKAVCVWWAGGGEVGCVCACVWEIWG